MTQCDEGSMRKGAELAGLFLALDEAKQDSALRILRALEFAQSFLRDTLSRQIHSKKRRNEK